MNSYQTFGYFDKPRTYYETLEIKSDASQQEIKAAYIRLARQYHPDLNNDITDSRMIELNQIYGVLSNPEKKKAYDAMHFPEPARDFRQPFDFTRPRQEKSDTKQKSNYSNVKKPQYLKTLRIGLTVVLICLVVYLIFYLVVNMVHLFTVLPDWLLKLAPTTIKW
jgi:hypothetical protein